MVRADFQTRRRWKRMMKPGHSEGWGKWENFLDERMDFLKNIIQNITKKIAF